jgi:hypothetical protein
MIIMIVFYAGQFGNKQDEQIKKQQHFMKTTSIGCNRFQQQYLREAPDKSENSARVLTRPSA